MMIFLRKLLVVVSALVVFLFAVELFLISLSAASNAWMLERINSITTYLYQDPSLRVLTLTLSALLLLTCLSVILSLISFGRRERVITLKTPYGDVSIALGAIEDFVKVAKEHISGVQDLRPKVFVRGQGLKIYVRASLWSDQSIPAVAHDIQDTIQRYIQDTLGIDQHVEIRVFVGKITFRATADVPVSAPRPIQYQEFRQ